MSEKIPKKVVVVEIPKKVVVVEIPRKKQPMRFVKSASNENA